MADVPYSRFDSEKVHDLSPDHRSGGPSGGGPDLEARIAKLEADMEYVKRDVGELRTDMRDVRDRVVKIEQNMATKGFVFTVYIIVSGLLAAVTLFPDQIRHFLGVTGS